MNVTLLIGQFKLHHTAARQWNNLQIGFTSFCHQGIRADQYTILVGSYHNGTPPGCDYRNNKCYSCHLFELSFLKFYLALFALKHLCLFFSFAFLFKQRKYHIVVQGDPLFIRSSCNLKGSDQLFITFTAEMEFIDSLFQLEGECSLLSRICVKECIAAVGIDYIDKHPGGIDTSVFGTEIAPYVVKPGIVKRINVYVIDVVASDATGAVYGVIGCIAIVEGLEIEIVVRCIDGVTYIDGFCPGTICVFPGVEDVISSHVVMAIGAEIEDLSIFTDIGAFLIVAGVDGGPQIFGRSPLPAGLLLRQVDIESAMTTLPVTGEIEGLPIFAETGMGFPVFGGYIFAHFDCWAP